MRLTPSSSSCDVRSTKDLPLDEALPEISRLGLSAKDILSSLELFVDEFRMFSEVFSDSSLSGSSRRSAGRIANKASSSRCRPICLSSEWAEKDSSRHKGQMRLDFKREG